MRGLIAPLLLIYLIGEMERYKMAVKTKLELENELKEKDDALSQMKAQMEQMQQMMAQITSQQSLATIIPQRDITSRKIKVISLCPNSLNLNTMEGGAGKAYNLPHYGYERYIKYDDLEEIVNACYKFVELFYICDAEAVEELGLSDIYEKMVDKQSMDIITDLQGTISVEMFKQLSDTSKEKAIDMIIDKIVKGQEFDENMVYKLNSYLNVDLRAKAKDVELLGIK